MKTLATEVKFAAAAAALLVVTSCGARPTIAGARFINQSQLTMEYLETSWVAAQETIATKPIELNPVQRILHGTPSQFAPPDSRARTIAPSNVYVRERRDNGGEFFMCGSVRAHGCTSDAGSAAPMIEFAGNYPQVIEYEDENIILRKLGYNIAGR